ncbi:hypothetical protein A7K91_00410 [Paenibacillus oryzae]|uniref:Nudix hydrolase domain-containing protein n=1 Tax=Paenibacillus oryzae TaxID=1844972 RepID=A0A1A5YHM7_9BACL|nr:NUDIX hydrolase [Paenibacillus oryzae]OBR65176.1 hypothetical protein A7K91_00410 [Paenibacillus oryzae]
MSSDIFHRHLGVYGVCIRDNQLLVIHKSGGPYSGRYDLPGGSVDKNESILEAIKREFIEETGLQIHISSFIGTKDYIVPWRRPDFAHTHCHHIAILYAVNYIAGDISESPQMDDSLGAEWIDITDIDLENSSPLVVEAKQWIENGEIKIETIKYEEWTIRD